METLTIGENTFQLDNIDQIINMGGPWKATLFHGDLKISDNVLIDNILGYQDNLYFIKSHLEVYKYSFKINVFNLVTSTITEYDKKFRIVFIKNVITQNQLLVTKAFHGEGNFDELIIELNELEFSKKLLK